MKDRDRFEQLHYTSAFYKQLVENFADEIYVTDREGYTLFVNMAAVEVIGLPMEEIVGRHVNEMVSDGYFKPSVTMEVLKERKAISMIQTLANGKSVLVTGIPIFDEKREQILMVISTTKDIKALSNLISKVESQEEELSNLRDTVFDTEGFVAVDAEMAKMKYTIGRLAPLDIPILIEGETGVGKEIAVKMLHKLNGDKNKPFFKINCSIIPEHLIESELFGYVGGAFTGADKGGKRGKVEMAESVARPCRKRTRRNMDGEADSSSAEGSFYD